MPGTRRTSPSGGAGEYGYGLYPNVYTSLEVERLLNAAGPTSGEVVLRDGSTVRVRPTRPSDVTRVEDYLIGLSPGTRRLRCWSLAIEEHFYLLWPLVVRHASERRLLQICAGTIVAVTHDRWFLRGFDRYVVFGDDCAVTDHATLPTAWQ